MIGRSSMSNEGGFSVSRDELARWSGLLVQVVRRWRRLSDASCRSTLELPVEHDLGALVGPRCRGFVVGGAIDAEPVVGVVVDLGLALD